jgi:hypothetical protein
VELCGKFLNAPGQRRWIMGTPRPLPHQLSLAVRLGNAEPSAHLTSRVVGSSAELGEPGHRGAIAIRQVGAASRSAGVEVRRASGEAFDRTCARPSSRARPSLHWCAAIGQLVSGRRSAGWDRLAVSRLPIRPALVMYRAARAGTPRGAGRGRRLVGRGLRPGGERGPAPEGRPPPGHRPSVRAGKLAQCWWSGRILNVRYSSTPKGGARRPGRRMAGPA